MKRPAAVFASILGLLVFLGSISQPALAQDPLKVPGGMYKKVFENDQIRVLEVTFKPGESIGVHTHPDHFVYALEGGTLEITSDGKVNTADLKTGTSAWIPAQSHTAKSLAKTTSRFLVVELKHSQGAKKEVKDMK
jgi:quercetin dioxygenase-like cupin family protein